ncbi:MAG: hypothetical protein U9P37_04165, partial [Pseudomonadota bacterium]|nr:hypothetical protein [Pseudomonadota bacterium]
MKQKKRKDKMGLRSQLRKTIYRRISLLTVIFYVLSMVVMPVAQAAGQDFVGYATEGQNLGNTLLYNPANTPTIHKTNPTATGHTDSENVYVQELIPGYDET